MTHDQTTQHSAYAEGPAPLDVVSTIARFLRIARQRKETIIVVVCVHMLIGLAYFVLATRQYESTAKLLIIQQRQDHLSTVGDHDSSDNTMATHRELLTSPIVIQQAIERLAPPHRIDLVGKPPNEWVREIGKRLSAQITRKTNIIDVAYRSEHPEAAAAVVRAVIDSYLYFVEEKHKGTAGETLHVLMEKGQELGAKLEQKQSELQQFGQQVGHLATGSDDKVVEPLIQRALWLNDALLKAQGRRLELQTSLVSVKQAVERGEDINQHLLGVEETVGRQMMLSSLGISAPDLEVLGEQQKSLMKATSELDSLSAYYGPNHPRIAELQRLIASTEQYLNEYHGSLARRVGGSRGDQFGPLVVNMLEQAMRQAQQREQQLRESFEEARQQAAHHSGMLVHHRMLEREVTRLESQYDVLFDKIATLDMRQLQAPIQATVVREPAPETLPVSPRLRFLAVLCLGSGTLLGCSIVYVQDILDDRFGSPEELSEQLGVPILAMVKKLSSLPGEGLATIHTNALPSAVETEAFRTLRTTLSLTGDVCDRILISSSEPGDGKTTISANLAVAFAQAGKRTLVIDADLRRPGFTALMGLKGQPGVADILSSDLPPGESAKKFIQPTEVAGLDVLPVGLRRPNPAELLSGTAFIELLAWADSQYDRIIVDCPPVLAVSDAQVVGQLVDGAILVVRPESNHRRLVVRAVDSFRATGCRVLGVVANGLSHDAAGYGYGYGYGYTDGYGHDAEEEEASHGAFPQSEALPPTVPLAAMSGQSSSTDPMDRGPDGTVRPRRAA